MANDLLDLIEQLEQEHRQMRDALAHLAEVPADADLAAVAAALRDLAPVLVAGLDEHSAAEDNTLFPALGEAVGGAAEAFRAEHDDIRSWRDQLYESPSVGDRLRAGAELQELLEAHMDREEAMLFPSARDVLSRD